MMKVRLHKDDNEMIELYTVCKGFFTLWSVMHIDGLDELGIDKRWLEEVGEVELRQRQDSRSMTWEVV